MTTAPDNPPTFVIAPVAKIVTVPGTLIYPLSVTDIENDVITSTATSTPSLPSFITLASNTFTVTAVPYTQGAITYNIAVTLADPYLS